MLEFGRRLPRGTSLLNGLRDKSLRNGLKDTSRRNDLRGTGPRKGFKDKSLRRGSRGTNPHRGPREMNPHNDPRPSLLTLRGIYLGRRATRAQTATTWAIQIWCTRLRHRAGTTRTVRLMFKLGLRTQRTILRRRLLTVLKNEMQTRRPIFHPIHRPKIKARKTGVCEKRASEPEISIRTAS